MNHTLFYDVFHQVFWTIISFLSFYILMDKFVVSNIEKISKGRANYINKLTLQINQTIKKAQDLEHISHKIMHEEIPKKQEFYIETKLEPILQSISNIEMSKKNMLKQKLMKHMNNYSSNSIAQNVNLVKQLNIAANLIIEHNNLKKDQLNE